MKYDAASYFISSDKFRFYNICCSRIPEIEDLSKNVRTKQDRTSLSTRIYITFGKPIHVTDLRPVHSTQVHVPSTRLPCV